MTTQAPSLFNRYATLTQSPITESVAAQRDRARADQMVAMRMVAELRCSLKECSDDLESYVEAYYGETKEFPSERRRYERDIAPVKVARALLERTTP